MGTRESRDIASATPKANTAVQQKLDIPNLQRFSEYDRERIGGGGGIVADRPALDEDTGRSATQLPNNMGVINLSLNRGTIRPVFCDVLTFERDAFGQPIAAGANVATAYNEAGVEITTQSKDWQTSGTGIAFDSSNPTGGDSDLGTPNAMYGGPGQGNGGESNDTALGNLLIRAEDTVDNNGDGLVDDPDDHAAGAMFTFQFQEDKCVGSLDLVDIEQVEVPARITMYDQDNNNVSQILAGGLGNNSVEHVEIGVCGVDHMKVQLQSSGALHDVSVCNAPEPPTSLFIDLDLIDVVGLDFDLRLTAGNSDGETALSNERFSMDPALALNGGALLPIPISLNRAIPAGTWTRIDVHMENIEARHADGTLTPIAGSVDQSINVNLPVQNCGSVDVNADWYIDARFEGDQLGLGVGFQFDNVRTNLDTSGC